jgi:type VI protein secretion system component Hcp
MSSTRARILQPIASSFRWLVVGLALVVAVTATLRAETRTSSVPPVEGGGVFDPKLAAVSGANYVFLDLQRTVGGAPQRIKGEATLRGFEGLTRVTTVQGLGAVVPVSSPTTTGKSQLGELTLTHYYDLISPQLFRLTAAGELLNPSTNVQFVKVSGGTQQVLLKVFLGKSQVIEVKEAQPQGSTNLVETVRFLYQEVLYEYYTYDAEGRPTGVVKACWDSVSATSSWQGKPCT